MTKSVFGLVLWLVSATRLVAIEFDRYHSQEEIRAFMQESAAAHPDLVRMHHLGYSERGREINYVVVSKVDPESVPAIYMNATHHGNEKSGTEGVVGLLDYLVKNQTNPDVASLLETYAIYIQPLVNPDGHAAHSRYDARGMDPNRDYAYPERADENSFKSPQIRLVKELADRVRFRAAAAYHSGMEAVLWPWCYTAQRNPDQDTFFTLSRIAAQAMGMSRYAQSYSDYRTLGEFIDYSYMAHGTLAVTFEVSSDPTPPPSQLARVVARSIAGGMAFMMAVKELDQGILPIQRLPESRPTLMSQAHVSPFE